MTCRESLILVGKTLNKSSKNSYSSILVIFYGLAESIRDRVYQVLKTHACMWPRTNDLLKLAVHSPRYSQNPLPPLSFPALNCKSDFSPERENSNEQNHSWCSNVTNQGHRYSYS
ncbi:Minor extracellular protease vpr [Fusarium oxysporum f. sp. albedinis]|nr:Uncharacterized protein HZ326_25277 [Fusarium oxysporum f. sp. albedinis]KAJ0133950.1 Minor extracellular protease vpr [Fusarium oxysporum f. sp. albedinis]